MKSPNPHRKLNAVLWAPAISRPHVEDALSRIPGLHLTSIADESEFDLHLTDATALIFAQQFQNEQVARRIHNAPNLKWIQLLTAGYDSFVRFPPPPGVELTTAGGGLAPAVGEHALALLLALGRRVQKALDLQAVACWDRSLKEGLFSLDRARVAVVGFGAIGQEAARRLRAFNAYVISVSRRGLSNDLADESHPVSRLLDIVGTVDAIVVALPLHEATRHIFDERIILGCKPGCLFVNVGRGELVDQQALVSALKSGHLGGAGLDVVDPEPLPPNSALWAAPNTIITPHCAAGGGYARLGRFIADNAREYMAHGELQCIARF